MTARKASRDRRPAHLDAPARLRQSDVLQPFMFLHEERGFLSRLFGRTAR